MVRWLCPWLLHLLGPKVRIAIRSVARMWSDIGFVLLSTDMNQHSISLVQELYAIHHGQFISG
jgi:hypothetical protein